MTRRLNCHRSAASAFVSLEALIATAIFAAAGLGLAIALNSTIDAAIAARREGNIAWNLESKLVEARIGPITVGKETSRPDALGVVYDKEITHLDLKTKTVPTLSGMYKSRSPPAGMRETRSSG